MAEKKSAMGDDPLAWLADGEESLAVEKKTPAKRTRVRRSTAASKAAKSKAKPKTEIEIVEETFAALAPQGEALAARFYERLFEEYPETEVLFEDISIVGQEKKLLASLVLLVQNLRNSDVLTEYLHGLGARHVLYGVTDEDYPKVAENLLAVIEEFAGALWVPDVQLAWENTLNTVATIMLEAYEPTESNDMPITQTEDIETKKLITEYESQLTAIDKVMGVITFDMDGIILDVNENFINVVGYDKAEIVGQHHRMFAEPSLASSPEYSEFWAKLNRGEFDSGEYKRIGKGGREIWLQASYNPILDLNGKPYKVVKYATEITEEKLKNADTDGQRDAIDKVMGVITFNMDGIILDVNENFINVVGYDKAEIVGQHHRMFAEPSLASSPEYSEFWAKLNRGEFDSGEYKRIGKGGREIWLQASYNPILDLNGKPYKVVKYATDISPQKALQSTINKVLESTSSVMTAMAEGDLTQRFEGEYEGEFLSLQTAINNTVEKISSIVSEINEAAVSIGTGATEITRGNVDLSQRTEEQASSLEETASSMEELTSTVRQNSDNAAQANQLAASAREQAEKGGSVIKEAIEAMAAISTSSKKVTDIIGVIDEIAFQTNLLALNAAVEAARAGEQGRGFAVVASEVRNLAQRSAAAAKEIKELINDSGEKVKEGSMLVDESGRTLEDIVSGAKKVGDIISEIAAAGAEQTSGIGQVNTAIGQMDEMTQQNAALVEEAAAASESLDEQGKNLQRMMAFFDVGDDRVEVGESPVAESPAPKAAPTRRAAKKPAAPKASPAVESNDDEWGEF